MLKKRIIPKFLLKFKIIEKDYLNVFVTSKQFKKHKNIGDPISQAKIFESQLADELLLLNIDSYKISEDAPYVNFLKKISSEIYMPLTVGGGVKSLNCISLLLKNGADKIFINSQALINPSIIKSASREFGAQCIVIGVDFYKDNLEWIVHEKNETNKKSIKLYDWVKKVEDLGAGEIVLTDVQRDGMGVGLNLEVGNKVSNIIKIPIILSGGCGVAKHFIEGFSQTKAMGISAGSYFANRDQNIFQTRSQILNSGIPLRRV
mgnify:FL=1|tara:strand:- start:16859 stop:17644 length:786 start_codon:yes stop_codon:yes gene_type:complete